MKTQHLIMTLLFSMLFQTAFSHTIIQWLNTKGQKPRQIICLSGNKKNGRVIMTYSLLDAKKIDYCYFGEVKNGKPNGQGQEFFKFSTVGFNKDSIKLQNFGANGYYLEVKGTYVDGNVSGRVEVVFNTSGNKNTSQNMTLEKAIGVFDPTNEDNQVFEIYFNEIAGLKRHYIGAGISKDEICRIAERFANFGTSTISFDRNLEGVFKSGPNEKFEGICDKNLLFMEGIKSYQFGTDQITCYIKKYDVFPVRMVNSNGERFFVLTDAEEKELKRVMIDTDTITDKNLFISLENARNTLLKQDFMDSRTLTSDYRVFKHTSEYDVLLKFCDGKLGMKVVSNKKLVNPIISWKRNLIVPLDSKFKNQFNDGHYYWWDSVHSIGTSFTNEQSWKFFDSIHRPFPIGYFGMKFEVGFANNKYDVEIPFVLISETARNEIKRLGLEANRTYQQIQKEKEAKEKAFKEQQEADRLALRKKEEERKKNEEERKRNEELLRVNRIKTIQKGDVVCYSQGWEYSEGFWVFYESGKFDMIATLMVDDVTPNGNVIFVVNNVASSSENRYQAMKYENLIIKEDQKISVSKTSLISDSRFQFCR